MTFSELVEVARAELEARAEFIKRFEPGGDLEWIEDSGQRANLIGPPAMLATFLVELDGHDTAIVGPFSQTWEQCHPSVLRALALAALRHADTLEAARG